jgi:hypothetical protein
LIERMIPSLQSSEPYGQYSQGIALQSALNRVRMRRLIQERKEKLAVKTKLIHLTLFAIIYRVIIMIFY